MRKLSSNEEVIFLRLIYPKTGKTRTDWPERWEEAGIRTKWEGVTDKRKWKARVDSPIWRMMASLYPDGTNQDMPPFAINSCMGWETEQGEKIHERIQEYEEESEIDEDKVINSLNEIQIVDLLVNGKTMIETCV